MLLTTLLEAAILVGLVILLLKKSQPGSAATTLQGLSDGLIRLESKSDHLDTAIRSGIQDVRSDLTTGLGQARDDASRFFDQVRSESMGLRELVGQKLQSLAEDSGQRHISLAENINAKLAALQQEIGNALAAGHATQAAQAIQMKETVESTLSQLGRDIRESTRLLTEEVKNRLQEVAKQLTSLSEANERRQEALRLTVEGKLQNLQESNTAKLEEMRSTVDEKLHSTLEKRLTESFGLVAERLENVQAGLGEMKDLAIGVGDLKKVLTNVRVRGGLGENQCQMQLDQVLSPEQYIRNAVVKEGTKETVEYAIRIPNGDQPELLLPIDVKFPKEDWERLEDAMEHGTADDIAVGRKRLAIAIKTQAKKICDKYINPPRTTLYALMYLPTEGLFAEVLRVAGLVDDLQTQFHVCIAGPTTFVALLNSLQMGFRTVAIQKKGMEVWRVLGAAKMEFEKFGGLMSKVERQVGTVQNTLKEIRGKTTTINRTLKGVEATEMRSIEVPPLLDTPQEDPEAAEDEFAGEEGELEEMAASEGE